MRSAADLGELIDASGDRNPSHHLAVLGRIVVHERHDLIIERRIALDAMEESFPFQSGADDDDALASLSTFEMAKIRSANDEQANGERKERGEEPGEAQH